MAILLKQKPEAANTRFLLPKVINGDARVQRQKALDLQARLFPSNSAILDEGGLWESVVCVQEGWMALSKSLVDGQTQIIDFVLPGDIIDPRSANGETSFVAIDTLTQCSVAMIPCAQWDRMLADFPDLREIVHCMDAAGHSRCAERMLRMGKGTAEMRVAYALLELWIRLGVAGDAGYPTFHIPLTQKLLGEFAGLSSVHVCRTMRRMVRNGIIAMDGHMDIQILEADGLAELAGVDPEILKTEIMP